MRPKDESVHRPFNVFSIVVATTCRRSRSSAFGIHLKIIIKNFNFTNFFEKILLLSPALLHYFDEVDPQHVESPPKNCDEKIMIHHHEVLVVNDVLNDPK